MTHSQWRFRAPTAPAGLMERVIAARAQGLRTTIPDGAPAVPRPIVRPPFVYAAVAVLVAGGALLRQWPPSPDDGVEITQTLRECGMTTEMPWLMTASALVLATACGQEPTGAVSAAPAAPAVLEGRGLEAGTWVYESGRRDGSSGRRRHTYELARVGDPGETSWQSVSNGAHRADTLWYTADGSRPIRQTVRVARGGKDLWAVDVTYGTTIASVVSDYLGNGKSPPQRRAWSNPITSAGPTFPAVHGPAIVHLVRQLPLAREWSGSVQAGPFGSQNPLRQTSFHVEGEGIVRVPAGVFDCWRVTVANGASRLETLWVSKTEQLLVRALSGSEDAGVEAVLVSFTPQG